MNELIWVGNTLYPRWFVFAAPLAALLAVVLLVCALSFLLRWALSLLRKEAAPEQPAQPEPPPPSPKKK